MDIRQKLGPVRQAGPVGADQVPPLVARGIQLDRQRDFLVSGARPQAIAGGTTAEVAAWTSNQPRWVIVHAVAEGPTITTGAPPVEFQLAWQVGPFAPPVALFNQSGPIVLFASRVVVSARHPGAGGAPAWNVSAFIAPFDGGAFPQARPLFAAQPGYSQVIAAAGNAWYQVSPYARRFRVGRSDPAQSFRVSDVGGLAPFVVAANVEMDWMELAPLATGGGLQLQVQNTGAGPASFALYQELAL